MDAARLWISLSRFTVELNIYFQYLDWSRSGAVNNLQEAVSQKGWKWDLWESGDCVLDCLRHVRPSWHLAEITESGLHLWACFHGVLVEFGEKAHAESL